MKKFITLFTILILVSCSSNQVTITKEEYDKLKGTKIVIPEYPKPFHFQKYSHAEDCDDWQIILGQDNHEYLESMYHSTYVIMHYIDCKLCRSRIAFPSTIETK